MCAAETTREEVVIGDWSLPTPQKKKKNMIPWRFVDDFRGRQGRSYLSQASRCTHARENMSPVRQCRVSRGGLYPGHLRVGTGSW